MEQIQEGLFAVEDQMPCAPNQIGIYPYMLPATLGRAEREEAAARILTFSKQLDQWVGVSWSRLAEMMKDDYDAHQKDEEAREHNFHEQWRFHHELRKYWINSICTFGIYALFVPKPTEQMQEVSDKAPPFSGIFFAGPGHVITGIHELIEADMLRRVTEGEGEDAIDVFFPTPALVSRVMRAQGVTA